MVITYVCTSGLQIVFIFYIYAYEPATYGNDYEYPKWAEYMGLCMSLTSMIWVPLYAIYFLITTPGTLREVTKALNAYACT